MLPNIQVAELLKREITIGDTLFRFAELSAWEAYPMLERIRHEIAHTEASIRGDQPGTDGTAEAAALFKMVMGARPQFVRELQAEPVSHGHLPQRFGTDASAAIRRGGTGVSEPRHFRDLSRARTDDHDQFPPFFSRSRLPFGPRPGGDGADSVATVNIPPFLAAPVGAGLCRYSELKTLTLNEVADMNKILAVRAENEHRAMKAARRDAKRKQRGGH